MGLECGYNNYNGTVSSVTLLHRLPVSTKGFRAFRNRALSSRKRARQVRGRLLTPTFQLRKHLRPPPPGYDFAARCARREKSYRSPIVAQLFLQPLPEAKLLFEAEQGALHIADSIDAYS